MKQQSLQDHLPISDYLGLTSRALPHQIIALSGIYVDEFLTAGPTHVVQSFLAAARKWWRTSDPQFLSLDADLPFLGVSIRMTKVYWPILVPLQFCHLDWHCATLKFTHVALQLCHLTSYL